MTQKLTIYSPAPASTRLHELNEEFGALLQAAGLDNEVIAVALPDSINHISGLPAEERAFHLPIVTTADLLPAIEQTGPDWHAYNRPCPDLKLAASLYDVAFGVTAVGALVKTPADLKGRTVYAPFRPSSVRLLTEELVNKGWELEGDVEIEDSTPLDLGPLVGRNALKATSWNITTLEDDRNVPLTRLRNAQFLPVDDEVVARLNERLHFKIGTCTLNDVQLIAFRQGIAVWDDTPAEITETILKVLTSRNEGPFFYDAPTISDWPGLDDTHRHPALLSLVGH